MGHSRDWETTRRLDGYLHGWMAAKSKKLNSLAIVESRGEKMTIKVLLFILLNAWKFHPRRAQGQDIVFMHSALTVSESPSGTQSLQFENYNDSLQITYNDGDHFFYIFHIPKFTDIVNFFVYAKLKLYLGKLTMRFFDTFILSLKRNCKTILSI